MRNKAGETFLGITVKELTRQFEREVKDRKVLRTSSETELETHDEEADTTLTGTSKLVRSRTESEPNSGDTDDDGEAVDRTFLDELPEDCLKAKMTSRGTTSTMTTLINTTGMPVATGQYRSPIDRH